MDVSAIERDDSAVDPAICQLKQVDARVRTLRRLMEVQVTVASTFGRDTQFEYSIRWFDANGMLIPYFPGSWFPEEIPGTGNALIFEIAPSPDAVKLEINCREVFHNRQTRTHSQPLLLCFNANSN